MLCGNNKSYFFGLNPAAVLGGSFPVLGCASLLLLHLMVVGYRPSFLYSPHVAQFCHKLRLKLSTLIGVNLLWQFKIAEYFFVQDIDYNRSLSI